MVDGSSVAELSSIGTRSTAMVIRMVGITMSRAISPRNNPCLAKLFLKKLKKLLGSQNILILLERKENLWALGSYEPHKP